MSYASFLLIFIGPPILLGVTNFLISKDEHKMFFLKGILVLCLLAFIWTTPWDNYLVANNIWGYGLDRVFAVIGYVPVEEYCFFFLQTLMSGFYTYFILSKTKLKSAGSRPPYIVLSALVILFLIGSISLFYEDSLYLGLILVWATPICLLQWLIGGKYLSSNWKTYLLTTIPPTIYLWFADAYAISEGIWYISDKTILGIKVGVLPIEEATFFLVTNMMVTQGLILFVCLRHKLPEYKSMVFRNDEKRA